MERINFSLRHTYSAERGIELPIELRLVGSKIVRINANVDTGASFCIFQREYGEQLGLDIERGVHEFVRTADDGRIELFGHNVLMTCLDWDTDSLVFFAKDYSYKRNVLGQRGWLDQFKIGIVHYDGALYLSPYNE